MQKDIHPKFFPKAQVSCACGKKYVVGSSKETFAVEICSSCHPFYSGTEKTLDIAGRVERFKTRQSKAAPAKKAK